jgi:adenylate cyclase
MAERRGNRMDAVGYYALVFAILIGALGLRVLDPSPIARLRLLAFDTYHVLDPRLYDPDTPVRIIDIDEASLARYGQWPWPRTLIAELVTQLAGAGAVAIAFDMVFPEPDRMSPREVIGGLPRDLVPEAVRASIDELPDNDEMLADIVATTPTVMGIVLRDGVDAEPPDPKAGFAFAGDDPAPFLAGFSGVVSNIAVLQARASGLGALNWIPELDQVIRRVPLMLRGATTIYPTLSAEALRVAQGASTFVVKSSGASGALSFGQSTGVVALKIGALTVPTDAQGFAWIHFTKYEPARYVPAWRVLEGEVTSQMVGGYVVFIGSSAAGLFDLQTTPVESGIPGVEAHAQAVESIIANDLLMRPDYAVGLELVYLALAGALLIFLMRYVAVSWCLVACLACLGAVNLVSWLAFREQRLLLDPVYPSIGLIAVFVAGELNLFFRTEKERRYIRGAFSRYLSPDLVKKLGDRRAELELGGETREMTLMFCDVRGFTQISEGLSASELTSLINRFLTPMTGEILDHRGTIDKYMGDAIMAFWNAPLDDPDHAAHACGAALAMIAALEALNRDLEAEASEAGIEHKPLRIGIGINTGEASVGNMGSAHRFDYSVIGDNVNLASRLEGQTKVYGVTILTGERTLALAPGVAAVELDLIRVKGKRNAERIFTILPAGEADGLEAVRAAQAGLLDAYRGMRWEEAVAAIARCRTVAPRTLMPYYDAIQERIARFTEVPPPPEWDGTYDALTK